MLTAKAEEFDKVLGLESGADDYITKDRFSVREFTSRVRAQLRRAEMGSRREATTDVVKVDDLEVDVLKRNVFARENKVELTYMEFELLKTLISIKALHSRGAPPQMVWATGTLTRRRRAHPPPAREDRVRSWAIWSSSLTVRTSATSSGVLEPRGTLWLVLRSVRTANPPLQWWWHRRGDRLPLHRASPGPLVSRSSPS
jgi:DNA-binding response OmpR family regulator